MNGSETTRGRPTLPPIDSPHHAGNTGDSMKTKDSTTKNGQHNSRSCDITDAGKLTDDTVVQREGWFTQASQSSCDNSEKSCLWRDVSSNMGRNTANNKRAAKIRFSLCSFINITKQVQS